MAIFDGFFGNALSGALNPKGNLADWRHASRLFIEDKMKYAPKTKFLYHVQFFLSEPAKSFIPGLDKFQNKIGGLVYQADLPSYSAAVETRNKYNRKKNFQTAIEYQPISIVFYDDNFGVTTKLLESYYKYYFADSFQELNSGAYGDTHGRKDLDLGGFLGTNPFASSAPQDAQLQKEGQTLQGDTLYSRGGNNYRFGMDNFNSNIPFFSKIEISQLARKTYNTFTLVRPILTEWDHDSVDNKDGATAMSNSITVRYESVLYTQGEVEAGSDGDPTGFGDPAHYDNTPSSLTTLGGGAQGIGGILGGAGEILGGEYGIGGTIVAGANIVNSAQNLTTEGVIEEGLNAATDLLGNIGDEDLGGLPGTYFPKKKGPGGDEDLTLASITDLGVNAAGLGDTSGLA